MIKLNKLKSNYDAPNYLNPSLILLKIPDWVKGITFLQKFKFSLYKHKITHVQK